MKFNLHPNWRQAWKWANMRMIVMLAAAPELWVQFGTMQSYISRDVFHRVMSALAVLVAVNIIRKKAAK